MPEPVIDVSWGTENCSAGRDLSEFEAELSDDNFEACLDDTEGLVGDECSEPDEGSGGKWTIPVLEKSRGFEAWVE